VARGRPTGPLPRKSGTGSEKYSHPVSKEDGAMSGRRGGGTPEWVWVRHRQRPGLGDGPAGRLPRARWRSLGARAPPPLSPTGDFHHGGGARIQTASYPLRPNKPGPTVAVWLDPIQWCVRGAGVGLSLSWVPGDAGARRGSRTAARAGPRPAPRRRRHRRSSRYVRLARGPRRRGGG